MNELEHEYEQVHRERMSLPTERSKRLNELQRQAQEKEQDIRKTMQEQLADRIREVHNEHNREMNVVMQDYQEHEADFAREETNIRRRIEREKSHA